MLTNLDPPYETIEDLKIGRLLDQYGIPFFYKQATIIYNEGRNEIWKPAFTLCGYDGAVVDYVAGTGGNPQEQVLTRDRIYRYNQIPAVVLGPPDLDKANWDKDLYAKLAQLCRQAVDPMRYMLAGGDQEEGPR